jgi:hypothetical protein
MLAYEDLGAWKIRKVDSQYTAAPFLKPVVGEGVNVLGHVCNKRKSLSQRTDSNECNWK